jgi:ribosomal-protein-alanine N-acetyltransferase
MATQRRPSPDIRLRPGELGDLDDVMAIMGSAFHPCYGEAWTKSQCAGILPMKGVTMTIAESDHGPVGFSLVRAVADEAELLLVAVAAAEQGHGIGRLLLEEFVNSARSGGAGRLHLEVRDGNPAMSLYRQAGFEPMGRRRNYYHGPDGEAFDAVTLALTN